MNVAVSFCSNKSAQGVDTGSQDSVSLSVLLDQMGESSLPETTSASQCKQFWLVVLFTTTVCLFVCMYVCFFYPNEQHIDPCNRHLASHITT